MKERVIIQVLQISRKGELQHFQVRIPRDAARIIGVETGVRVLSQTELGWVRLLYGKYKWDDNAFAFYKTMLMGDVRLQSCEQSNLFYAGEVYEREINLGAGDFTSRQWPVKEWTHGLKREEVMAEASGDTTILQGTYRDRIGEHLNMHVKYEVKIYVWYEREVS